MADGESAGIREYATDAVTLIHAVLQPHAYLNARRARGMLDAMKAHHGRPYFPEVCVRAEPRLIETA